MTLEAARAINMIGHCVPPTVRTAVDDHWNGRLSVSAHESLKRALDGERIPPAPEHFGVMRPSKLLRGGGAASATSPTGKGSLSQTNDESLPELDDDEDSDESKILKLLSSPLNWENPLLKMLRNQMGMSRRPSPDDNGGSADMPVGSQAVADKVGANARAIAAPPGLEFLNAAEPTGDFCYPEWDWHRRCYREAWCRVGEFDPPPRPDQAVDHPRIDPLLRRQLARLGLAYRRHDRQEEGDSLDPEAITNLATELATGEIEDPRVYQARLRSAHDLGVIVLIDASGSTGERHASGDPIWERQRMLAANLVMALEEVGDRVACYGFTSRGRNQIRFLRVKDFEGRLDQGALKRLAAIEPAGFTRMGAAIRHSTHLAATKAGTSNRLLVVISDGFPYDDDYQGSYAEHDTRRALSEAVDQAVGCVCLSVGTSTDEAALERLWGHVSHVGLLSPNDMGRHLLPLFGSALKAASGRRRDERGKPTSSLGHFAISGRSSA